MESVFVADSKIEINAELSKSQQNLIKEECPLENPLEETGQNNAGPYWLFALHWTIINPKKFRNFMSNLIFYEDF